MAERLTRDRRHVSYATPPIIMGDPIANRTTKTYWCGLLPRYASFSLAPARASPAQATTEAGLPRRPSRWARAQHSCSQTGSYLTMLSVHNWATRFTCSVTRAPMLPISVCLKFPFALVSGRRPTCESHDVVLCEFASLRVQRQRYIEP